MPVARRAPIPAVEAMPESIRLSLLGGFALEIGSEPQKPVRVTCRKAAALVAYLAMHPEHCAGREQLAALLWGDRFDKQARQNLRQCLRWLRTQLAPRAPRLLALDGEEVRLDPRALRVDAIEFARLAESAEPREWQRAADLYRGEFLAGSPLAADGFDEWVAAERIRLEAMAVRVFAGLADRYDRDGDGRKALDAATRLVALDPLREDWQRRRLRLCARYHGSEAAIAQTRALDRLLRKELDVGPSPATQALIAEIVAPAGAHPASGEADAAGLVAEPPVGMRSAVRCGRPTVVVLPFASMEEGPERQHFAAALADETAIALARIKSLCVVAHDHQAIAARRAAEAIPMLRALGIDYVLEGGVRQADGRVRVTARLVDAATGSHIWAERYDRKLARVLSAQDAIAANIAASVEPYLYAAEGIRARRCPPHELDARGCVMRALALVNSRSPQSYALAEELLRRASELDADCAQAHSLFAYITALGVVYGWKPREETMRLAREAAHKAVLLDVDDPWSHLALGFVHAQSRSSEAAILEYEKALALNPGFALAHTYLGGALSHLGRSSEALAEIDTAERLGRREIFFGVNNYVRANAHFAAERYEQASAFARRSVLESPGIITSCRQLVVNSVLAGRIPEAKAALERFLRLVPGSSLRSIDETLPYVRAKDRSRFLEAFCRLGVE